ncbi:hypothetical protein RQP46_005524 [Phenoliferia psychrophenolica]
MQHEVLLLLSSHPSPLLSSPSGLLHPGERESLARLATLAKLHSLVSDFCAQPHATTSLSALSAVLTERVVRPFTQTVLTLEEQVLRGQLGTGTGVPLALIIAETSSWEGILGGVKRLVDAVAMGPAALTHGANNAKGSGGAKGGRRVAFEAGDHPERDDEDAPATEWTSAPLLSLLYAHSNTGLLPLADVLHAAIASISTIFTLSLTSFLIFGRLASEPLVVRSPGKTPVFSFPSRSLPILPTLADPSTRTAVHTSLSNICLALTLLNSIPPPNAISFDPKSARRSDQIELGRGLRKRLEVEMEGCTGPGDETFALRISIVESLLSTHLLEASSLHLPSHLLISHLTLLGATFLLRTGAFASNLSTELAHLRVRPLASLSSLDLSGALFRASTGTSLDSTEDVDGDGDKLEAFQLVLSRDEDLEDDAFAQTLLGPSIALRFTPTPAMALVLSPEVLGTYGRIWSYLMAIKGCHGRLLSTWASLAQAQRLRRRFTGATEGGLDAHETRLREGVVRGVWGAVRSMLWFFEGVQAHFMTDVIDPAMRSILDRVAEHESATAHIRQRSMGGSSLPPTPMPDLGAGTSFGGGGTTGMKESDAAREREGRTRLDFTALTAVHSLYLSVLLSGLLLSSEELSGKMMEMMQTCDAFVAKVGRWGGDVLPGLLEGGMADEESAKLVLDRNETTFQAQLEDFFATLASPRRPSVGDTSISISLASTTGLHFPTSASHSKLQQQHPIVVLARAEAESAAREFLPQLLLRLDFTRWFSQADARKENEAERARMRSESIFAGLDHP